MVNLAVVAMGAVGEVLGDVPTMSREMEVVFCSLSRAILDMGRIKDLCHLCSLLIQGSHRSHNPDHLSPNPDRNSLGRPSASQHRVNPDRPNQDRNSLNPGLPNANQHSPNHDRLNPDRNNPNPSQLNASRNRLNPDRYSNRETSLQQIQNPMLNVQVL